jgi:hypothetical protein
MAFTGRRPMCCLALVLTLLSGCSSVRTVRPTSHPDSPAFGGARAGDQVSILLTDGQRVTFVIRGVEGDALVATTGDRYHTDEIVQLKRRVFSPTKTMILVAGVVAGAILLSIGAAMGSLAGGM